MYEDWLYDGIDINFAYSDMDILEQREFVLYEDGSFCGGWNKEIKKYIKLN